MTKQQILEECARRLGDTDPNFISQTLSPTFDFVLLELSQQECLPMLKRRSQFPLNTVSGANQQNILVVNTVGLLGSLPVRIMNNLLVPAWGPAAGWIMREDDMTFDAAWLANSTQPGRPIRWRPYPNIAEMQIHPYPRTEDLTALVTLDWIASPETLEDGDTIADVQAEDLPTLLAGLYRHGILYRDETFNDMVKAEGQWIQGVTRMKERRIEAGQLGYRTRIAYREF